MINHNINEVIASLNAAQVKIKHNITAALQEQLTELRTDLIEVTPVWRGMLASSWHIDPPTITDDNIEGSVFNSAKYAAVIEYGSPKGGRPWGKAGERTEENNGRIWSMQARNGMINELITDSYTDAITNSIMNNILSGI